MRRALGPFWLSNEEILRACQEDNMAPSICLFIYARLCNGAKIRILTTLLYVRHSCYFLVVSGIGRISIQSAEWSALQVSAMLMPPANVRNPLLEEALQFLKGPNFIP